MPPSSINRHQEPGFRSAFQDIQRAPEWQMAQGVLRKQKPELLLTDYSRPRMTDSAGLFLNPWEGEEGGEACSNCKCRIWGVNICSRGRPGRDGPKPPPSVMQSQLRFLP